jgi:two-component system nitrate/nitrite response regulator NarL
MPAPLRLFVVADDAVARAGLRSLAESAGFAVIGESPADELAAAAEHVADALVWDLGASGTLEALRAVSARLPVVVVLWGEEQAREAVAAGARSVLLRDGLDERLAPAVNAAVAGLLAIEPSLADALGAPRVRSSAEIVEALTPRESEVLQLLAEGFTNRRIGERLAISEHTVKFHVNAILGKLAAQTRGEAIAQAARLGLLLL